MADHPHDGNPERTLQARDVQRAAPRRELVDHGEDKAAGQAEPKHLRHQEQGPLDGAGIRHGHEGVGRRYTGKLAGEEPGDDFFVPADGRQAVSAGKVHHDHPATLDPGLAFATLDGDTWVVADLGPKARKCIEEGGFPGIRASDEAEA